MEGSEVGGAQPPIEKPPLLSGALGYCGTNWPCGPALSATSGVLPTGDGCLGCLFTLSKQVLAPVSVTLCQYWGLLVERSHLPTLPWRGRQWSEHQGLPGLEAHPPASCGPLCLSSPIWKWGHPTLSMP